MLLRPPPQAIGAAVLAIALVGQAAPVTAERNPYFGPNETGESCAPTVRQVLADRNIDDDSVEKVSYVVQRQSQAFSRSRGRDLITGYDAWVRPKGIKGHLVIEMWINCSVRQVYTRGDYRVPGVDAY